MDIIVSVEEYDRLQSELERPAKVNPKLRALLADRAVTP